MENVSLTISKEIVNPIVQAKINEAILAAMGGQNELINRAVQNILFTKVNHEGRVGSYSSENKYNWIDIVITKQIEEAVKEAMKEMLGDRKAEIKKEIIKQLSTKKAIESFAASLLDQTTKISDRYSSKITVDFFNKDY